MTSQRNAYARGLGLPATLVFLALSRPILAQEAGPDEGADAATTTSEPEGATAPADEDGATADGEVEADAAVEPPKPAPVTTPPDPAREEAVAHIGVERLPGSAYPAPRVRGIKGGSLWMTMHGLQWPYMPEIAGKPALRLGLSGSIWSDGSYARTESGLAPETPGQKRLAMQSRGVLRLTPTYSENSGWFVQGQAELVAQGDQLLDTANNVMGYTDDLWVRVGKWNLFDLTVGRFQAWEVANHYGMGLDLNTLEREGATIEAQSIKTKAAYGLTYFWDRADGRLGNYALHFYPLDILRFELLGQFGAGNKLGQAIQTNLRAAAILDLGFVKLKAGYEYGDAVHQRDENKENSSRNGFGLAGQFVLDPYIEGGIAFSRGYEDFTDQNEVHLLARSNTVTGVSGFLNGRITGPLILGVGALYSNWENLSIDERVESPTRGEYDFDTQLQAFAAIQYSMWDVLYVKFVGSYANWEHQDRSSTPFTNKMYGGRLRFMILF